MSRRQITTWHYDTNLCKETVRNSSGGLPNLLNVKIRELIINFSEHYSTCFILFKSLTRWDVDKNMPSSVQNLPGTSVLCRIVTSRSSYSVMP